MIDLLSGAVTVYHDTRYDKDQLEATISENLEQLRQKYKQSLKNLEVSIMDGKKRYEIQQLMKDSSGIQQGVQSVVVDYLEQILANKGDQKYSNLLKKVHYSQLINLDFKFASNYQSQCSTQLVTTADSMIMNNGKCFIHLKLDLLNEQNQREAVYTELTLEQFYQFFHELKRAHSLMEVVS
ncbi:comm domain-containing protein 7 [Stylonychia lemnae]|uniref:Comm domain-containing protein 7 n=1 Tax=Stylonychia lemnae TaxID=5949 RepID=A0A078A8M8_STYLE|nr:comm domain-containing protein 7 [Stylonychia lemnae]|eukprot:CDW77877.1 comm domain-containing protein 7 [Stylonychia lemnae]